MKIVIKLPNDLRERVLSFPLLHKLAEKLQEKIEEDDILQMHLISISQDIDVLNLLPFDAFYHELAEDDVKNVFSMHRACSHMKISNPDFFISATDSFVDASIGKNLGAKVSVGFAVGKNGWLLEKKITKSTVDHKSNQIYRLIKGVLDELPPMDTVQSRKLPALYSDYRESPYIILNLDLIEDKVNSEWVELIGLLTDKKIVLMCTEIPLDDQEEFLEHYIKELPRTNTYKTYLHDSNITFGKLVSYCAGFFTHDSPLANIASYCGATVLLINRKENLSMTGPKYFPGTLLNYSQYSQEYGVQGKHDYGKVFDDILKYIEAHTAVSKGEEEISGEEEELSGD